MLNNPAIQQAKQQEDLQSIRQDQLQQYNRNKEYKENQLNNELMQQKIQQLQTKTQSYKMMNIIIVVLISILIIAILIYVNLDTIRGLLLLPVHMKENKLLNESLQRERFVNQSLKKEIIEKERQKRDLLQRQQEQIDEVQQNQRILTAKDMIDQPDILNSMIRRDTTLGDGDIVYENQGLLNLMRQENSIEGLFVQDGQMNVE